MKRDTRRWIAFTVYALVFLSLPGCADDAAECFRSSDCPRGAFCEGGQCSLHLFSNTSGETNSDYEGPIVVAPADAGAESRSDDEFEFSCPIAAAGELQIEEVLSDVPAGDVGDANGDGTRDAYDDEFVEIANVSSHAVGLRGIALAVNDSEKYRFDPSECLGPMQVIVVFAGGNPTERHRVAGKRLGLANDGGRVSLVRDDGSTLAAATYPGEAAGSWVRHPPIDGDLLRHGDLTTRLFSPGTCLDGLPWDGECVENAETPPDGGFRD